MTDTPADTPSAAAPGPVHVVRVGARTVPVADRAIADEITALWNSQVGEGAPARAYARVVQQVDRWTDPGPVWDRVPDCRTVHSRRATVEPDGSLKGERTTQALRWEFEPGAYTTQPCRYRVERQPGGRFEVEAQGTDPVEVAAGFEAALTEAREHLS
ncbi:hypothetical protein ACIA8O_16420 [Kitasatospora sp. NPDC051853]|uniref:hypothetical protein n=1 Tax=Kitasatospora sp. NPDC051853 TaxID=3364058 RepID=UPI003793AD9A